MTDLSANPIELPNGATLSGEDQRKLSWTGEHSAEWLQRLPSMILEWCERWEITLEPTLPAINYNLVLFGTSAIHGPVAIKASPPHREVAAEVEAVRTSQGPGVVRIFDSDSAVSVMLQERVLPGTMLRQHFEAGEYNDIQATTIAATCMKRFWTPDPHSEHLMTLDRWFEALYAHRDRYPDGGGRIPKDVIDLAVHLTDHLLATEQDRYTVHGDLNPGNILRNGNGSWTIIDPKGLVAERGYEIGQWMLNPYGLHMWPNLAETLDTRLSILSEMLELDRFRLWQWAVAHSTLSECWTVADDAVDAEGLHAVDIVRALCSLPEGKDSIDPVN
jgi:streptomycin 6-kinase